MANATVAIIDKPAWVDLSSRDAGASRDFYAKVFGWKVEVNPDAHTLLTQLANAG